MRVGKGGRKFDNIKNQLYQKATEKCNNEVKLAQRAREAYLDAMDDALEAVERELENQVDT